MEKKKRIIYLDFIRVISMIIIVTYHFYAHFAENNITGIRILSNSKWGIIGVALFFMISGASLFCNYGEKIDLKKYFKKRFLGIFPMFWIAYLSVLLIIFYQGKGIPYGDLPVYKFIYSIIGMDGYLGSYTKTCYILGEWFLGCIILIYLLFPLYRLAINKYPKLFIIISSIINLGIILFVKNAKMPVHMNLLVNSYSFILGMYVYKYIKNIKIWQMIIPLLFAIGLYFIPTENVNYIVLISNFIAYFLFLVFSYIGSKITNIKIQDILIIISKYSYSVFLVHHYIIMKVESTFQNRDLGIKETICLYLTIWVIISIFARLLNKVNNEIVGLFANKENSKG